MGHGRGRRPVRRLVVVVGGVMGRNDLVQGGAVETPISRGLGGRFWCLPFPEGRRPYVLGLGSWAHSPGTQRVSRGAEARDRCTEVSCEML